MQASEVENTCVRLSQLLKNTIRTKLIKKELPCELDHGEALLFWFSDWMVGLKLIQPDQLWLVLETLAPKIIAFGNELGSNLHDVGQPRSIKDVRKLPVAKVGFLDRAYVCMDGWNKFLELNTGEQLPATDNMPVETIAYNLTSIYVRYKSQLQRINNGKRQGAGTPRAADPE